MKQEEKNKMLKDLSEGGVTYLPWIGDEYDKGIYYDKEGKLCYGDDKGKGKKVLVLGESFYSGNEKEEPTVIQELIEDFINPDSEFEPYKNTFIKFERAMAGKELDKEERKEFWQHVMFYEYVQKPLGGARLSPTQEQYHNSGELLFSLLEELMPDYFIVWGKRLYNNLPQEGKQGDDVEINGDYHETWVYYIKGKSIPFIGIYHPSAGFDWGYWNEIIREFFTKSR